MKNNNNPLTEMLNTIMNDVVSILHQKSPLTQDEIYDLRKIKAISYDGYSYGLDKAVKIKLVQMCDEEKDGQILYQLTK